MPTNFYNDGFKIGPLECWYPFFYAVNKVKCVGDTACNVIFIDIAPFDLYCSSGETYKSNLVRYLMFAICLVRVFSKAQNIFKLIISMCHRIER